MLQLSPTQWFFIGSVFVFVFMVVFIAWASPANRRAERVGNNLFYALFSSIMTLAFCGFFCIWSMTAGDTWFSAALLVNALTTICITSMNWYNFSVSRRLARAAGSRG